MYGPDHVALNFDDTWCATKPIAIQQLYMHMLIKISHVISVKPSGLLALVDSGNVWTGPCSDAATIYDTWCATEPIAIYSNNA